MALAITGNLLDGRLDTTGQFELMHINDPKPSLDRIYSKVKDDDDEEEAEGNRNNNYEAWNVQVYLRKTKKQELYFGQDIVSEKTLHYRINMPFRFYRPTFTDMDSLIRILHINFNEKLNFQCELYEIAHMAKLFKSRYYNNMPADDTAAAGSVVLVADFKINAVYKARAIGAEKTVDAKMSKLLRMEFCSGSEQQGTTCPICLDEFLDGIQVVTTCCCAHLFHDSCLRTWLGKLCLRPWLLQGEKDNESKDECPICSAEIGVD